MKSTLIKVMTLTVITMVLFTISCQQEEHVSPELDFGKVHIGPISDPKIMAEILAMANGRA